MKNEETFDAIVTKYDECIKIFLEDMRRLNRKYLDIIPSTMSELIRHMMDAVIADHCHFAGWYDD